MNPFERDRPRTPLRFARLAVTVVPFLFAPGLAPAEGGVEEVEKCVRANAPESTSIQTGELVSLGRSGADRKQEAKIYWKRSPEGLSRVFMEIEAPSDLRGSSYLLLQKEGRNDMFVYLPSLKKVRRISSRTISGSLFGTDFSYEDMERLQTLGSTQHSERQPDAELDGRPVYVVSSSPDPETGSAYEKVVSFVDRETCVPLKIEFYESGGSLRKVMTADPAKLHQAGHMWVPMNLRMKDLKRESESKLAIEEVEIDVEIPDRRFSQGQMGR